MISPPRRLARRRPAPTRGASTSTRRRRGSCCGRRTAPPATGSGSRRSGRRRQRRRYAGRRRHRRTQGDRLLRVTRRAVLRTIASPGPLPLTAVSTAGDVNRDGHADLAGRLHPAADTAWRDAGAECRRCPALRVLGQGRQRTALARRRTSGRQFRQCRRRLRRREADPALIGAPGAGPKNTGRTYVYSALTKTPAYVIDADDTGAALGAMFVAVAGDVDKDGTADVYASDFPNRAKGPQTGRVYVHSGKSGSRLLALTGEGPGEGFGTSASVAGDLDRDGHADLAVGAWRYSAAALSGGRIYIIRARTGRCSARSPAAPPVIRSASTPSASATPTGTALWISC